MKKMNLAVFFAALMALFSLSSCLDGDDNTTGQNVEIVKVNLDGMSFTSPTGYVLKPSNLTTPVTSNYAYVYYTYDTSLWTEGSTSYSVQLLSLSQIDSQIINTNVAGMEEYANAPIIDIPVQSSLYSVTFGWNAHTMFVPVYYYVKSVTSDSEVEAEQKAHSFILYCDMTEEMEDGTLVLKMRHHVTNPEENSKRNTTYTFKYIHFDLSSVLAAYASTKGGTPNRISIEFDDAGQSGLYENITTSKAVVNYANIVEYFNNNSSN